MTSKVFYKMLAEIHEAVSIYSCGCMGGGYTPERVERDDTHTSKQDHSKPIPFEDTERRKDNGMYEYVYTKSDTPLDYLGNIIREYIDVNDVVPVGRRDSTTR